ncbi:Ig-like domain-containing protein, partial [Zobellia sp.]|nr:Ig-like domain-containing protein [Zobellia sp.]
VRDFNDPLTYTVTAENGDNQVWTVNVTVAANQAPIANNDIIGVELGETVRISVIDNDSDADNPNSDLVISGVLGVQPENAGSFAIEGQEIVFTSSGDYTGDATFGYTINDGNVGNNASATVTVTIATQPNTTPTAADFSVTFGQDSTNNTIDLSTHINDGDEDALTVSVTSGPTNGTATVSGNTIVYTPNSGYNGADTIGYTVNDGNGGTATATVSVTVTPAPNTIPTAADFFVTFGQDSTNNNIDLSPNINDGDGDALTVSVTSGPTNGTATVSGNTIVYTPNSGYNGADAIGYTVNDGNGGTATATVSVTVTPAPNTTPTAADFSVTFGQDSTNNTIDLSTHINDGDEDALTVSVTSGPANGTATVSGNTIVYTPNSGYNGADTIGYTVNDGNGGTATATVSVTVTPAPNTIPTAADFFVTFGQDSTNNNIDLSPNINDGDGDALTVSVTSGPANGTATVSGNTIVYTPNSGYNGADTIGYTVNDGNGGTATATVSVTVNPVANLTPVAVDDTFTVSEAGNLNRLILTNDTDDENNDLTVNWVGGSTANVGQAVGGSDGGLFTITAGGSLNFNTNNDFNGLTDGENQTTTIQYRITDGNSNSNTATVTVTVTGMDDPNNEPTVDAGNNITITLPENLVTLDGTATDSDGTIASYSWTEETGDLTIIANPLASNTTVTGFSEGVYEFRLTVVDDDGASNYDTVLVTVNAAPLTSFDSLTGLYTAPPGSTVVINMDTVDYEHSGTGSVILQAHTLSERAGVRLLSLGYSYNENTSTDDVQDYGGFLMPASGEVYFYARQTNTGNENPFTN